MGDVCDSGRTVLSHERHWSLRTSVEKTSVSTLPSPPATVAQLPVVSFAVLARTTLAVWLELGFQSLTPSASF